MGPIKFEKVLENSITLSWNPPKKDGGSKVISYLVEISPDNGKTWKTVESVDAPTTVSTAKGLTAGTKYTFRVSAVNKVGKGEPLQSDEVTPQKKISKFECIAYSLFEVRVIKY